MKLVAMRSRLALVGCGAMLLFSGCAERKARAIPWATAVLVRPLPPTVRSNDAGTAVADIDPNFRIEAPATTSRIFSVRLAPARPRTTAPTATETANAGKTADDLVPELSPQETAAAKEQVATSIAIAERNATAARGKKLSPPQMDVLSKIAGFVADAREAAGEGDWARARNLAKKAQILSEDLAASL